MTFPHVRSQSQVQVVPCASDRPAVDQGGRVPSTHSSDFVNLLHWFTKPGETFYFLLDHWFYYYFGFIMEDQTQEEPEGRGIQSKAWEGCGTPESFPCVLAPLSVHQRQKFIRSCSQSTSSVGPLVVVQLLSHV